MGETDLARRLRRRIAATGPLSLAEWMGECLAAYYAPGRAIGAAGDFVTAPEVSQMFGELIGAWAQAVWVQLGAPRPVRLVELGPGRGTLMADLLRVTRNVPWDVHLVETSPGHRALQAGLPATWHDSLDGVPDGPFVLIANEFLDALPIRQFQRVAGGWAERLVDTDGDGFRLVLAATPMARLIGGRLPEAAMPEGMVPEGAVLEVCPAAEALAAGLAARACRDGGAALLIDYGHGGGYGDTLQAVRRHAAADPLAAPGLADLTAHVDFAALGRAAAAAGAAVHGPVGQGSFLQALGLPLRAARLKAAAPDQAAAIDAALHRLADPGQMGTLFKALAIAAPALGPLPGFEEGTP